MESSTTSSAHSLHPTSYHIVAVGDVYELKACIYVGFEDVIGHIAIVNYNAFGING